MSRRPDAPLPPRHPWYRRAWSYRYQPVVPLPGCLVLYSLLVLLFLFWLFVLFPPAR